MNNTHTIDRTIFDIQYEDRNAGSKPQKRIDEFLKKDLMLVIDEVFDKVSSDGFVYSIEKLEIDLGNIPYHTYEEEMPKKLRLHLLQYFYDIRHTKQKNPPKNSVPPTFLLDAEDNNSHNIVYFLEFGHLPGLSKNLGNNVLDALLEKEIINNPEKFSCFLKDNWKHKKLRLRLIRQFSEPVLWTMIKSLASRDISELRDYIVDFIKLLKSEHRPVFPKGIDPNDIHNHIWEQLIEFSFRAENRNLSTREIILQIIGGLFRKLFDFDEKTQLEYWQRLDHVDLSAKLSNVILPKMSRKTTKETHVQANSSNNKNLASSMEPKDPIEEKPLDHLAISLLNFINNLTAENAINLSTYWDTLFKFHTLQLEKTIRNYGQQIKIRKFIAQEFSSELRREILVLLEPSEYEFVEHVIESLENIDEHRHPSLSGPAKTTMMIWEFSLAFILVERGSQFNKKSFLKSLLIQISVSENMNRSDLLSFWLDGSDQYQSEYSKKIFNRKSNKLSRELIGFLTELKNELLMNDVSVQTPKSLDPHAGTVLPSVKIPIKSDKVDSLAEVQVVELYTHYYQIFCCLLSQCSSQYALKESQLVERINLLNVSAPWLSQRLFRELKISETALNRLLMRFEPKMILAFIQSILSLNMSGTGTKVQQVNFLKTVAKNADLSSNSHEFYYLVICRLLNGELVDVEELLDQCLLSTLDHKHSHRAVTATTFDAKHSEKRETSYSFDSAEQFVIEYLNRSDDLSAINTDKLISALELMLSENSSRFRHLLLAGLKKTIFLNRLAQCLPDFIHVKLLYILGVTHNSRLFVCADLISLACDIDAIKLSFKELQQFKWQFVYHYIADSGLLFNEAYFVCCYAMALQKLENKASKDVFVSTLVKNINQLGLSNVTSTITRSLIKYLSSQPYIDAIKSSDVYRRQSQFDITYYEKNHYETPSIEEKLVIQNAGIVLLAPYLPRLFSLFQLTNNSEFICRNSAERAVHLVQYLVNGHVDDSEYQLTINKIMCGIEDHEPIVKNIVLLDTERAQLDALLDSVISHWKVLGNTSVAGFRESFIQRQATLSLDDGSWLLNVESKPFDMLLDQIPWSYSMIKFAWMKQFIRVDWR